MNYPNYTDQGDHDMNPNHSSNDAPKAGKGPDGSEPVTQMQRGTHGDNESNASPTSESTGEFRTLAVPTALPPWLSEKFHWTQSAGGKAYLQPNQEFMAAVITDAPKFLKYGYRCLVDKDGVVLQSTERAAAEDLAVAYMAARDSIKAFDASEREDSALKRYILERITSNIIYASITQFEIDNWAARAASAGKDASDHQNFGEKQSRRDEFAHNGAIFHQVLVNVFPGAWPNDMSTAAAKAATERAIATLFEKQAKQLIYQQARMRTQELAAPQSQNAAEQQARAAAVLASRPDFN